MGSVSGCNNSRALAEETYGVNRGYYFALFPIGDIEFVLDLLRLNLNSAPL